MFLPKPRKSPNLPKNRNGDSPFEIQTFAKPLYDNMEALYLFC